jgi:hypothetical protein
MHDAAIGEPVGSAQGRLGRFDYEVREDPPVFIVRASGADGPALVRDSLVRAEAFGEAHPAGWCYITDTRRLVWGSVRNIRSIRHIRRLPNIRGYFVIARPPLSLVLVPLRYVGGPEAIVRRPEQALRLAAERISAS